MILLPWHQSSASFSRRRATSRVMGLDRTINYLSYFLVLLSSFCLELGHATDTIAAPNFIKDSETIISNDGDFILGFFSPANSTYRYVGIWYAKFSTTHAIWVANRNNPLKSTSGVVTISEDGNLVVLDGEKNIIWSSNVTGSVSNRSAQLLDSGNLLLQENTNTSIMWESFQHPSDSFLPKMKLSTNMQLTSWKSYSDPGVGTFSLRISVFYNLPEIYIWNGSSPYWRSGPWNGQLFIGIPKMPSRYLDGFNLIDEKQGLFSLIFEFSNKSWLLHYVLTTEGNLVETYSSNGKDWSIEWSSLTSECEVYGKCGAFGSCNSKNSPICSCLKGFEPKNIEEWTRENWTSGCVRRTPLQCMRANTTGEDGKKDGFLKVRMVKTPSLANWSAAFEDECKYRCLENCSCLAYAYDSGIGCMSWTREYLIDSQQVSSTGGVDLYVRVASSELDRKKEVKVIVIVTVVIGIVFVAVCTLFLCRRRAKHKARKTRSEENNMRGTYPTFQRQENLAGNINQDKLQELPIFSLEELASATNSFDLSNKLGQGGFGPVYRGKLLDGQEIAVKRLARTSGQGMQEFMNEVTVISKLQHRNLVRLLGGCVEGEEKLLVYEYMPNKSLDAFLFDPIKRELLDWKKRFNIIEGICRGLLYLHRDSRLRIIHRDLKASNILLDEELNPKISDFGMARIFGGNEDQGDTKRVVGTYGYMSPEYAMEGRFSEKSDIFSFGVLLLEIVCGRKNASFYDHDEETMNLLGFAWNMWKTDNMAAVIDPKVLKPDFEKEILRCIHVGLLCVQDLAKDRPTVSIAISMLRSEIDDLPSPRQLGFTANQTAPETQASYHNQSIRSINNVTVTMVHGR